MAISDLYDTTVDIQEVTRVQDALGSWQETWDVVHDNVTGRLWALSGQEVAEYAKLQVKANFGFMCVPLDPIPTPGMRITPLGGTRYFGITHIAQTMWKGKYIRFALLEEPNE